MRTTAVLSGDQYVLNGTKQWITNGENREIYTVMARPILPKVPGG